MTKRVTILSRILLILYLLAVGVLLFSSFTSESLGSMSIWNIPADKVQHFLLFFPFVFLAYCSFVPFFEQRSKTILLVLVFIAGVAVGGATELIQYMLPNRVCELSDFLTDVLSVFTSGVILSIIVIVHSFKKK